MNYIFMKRNTYLLLLSSLLYLMITSCDKTDKIINRETIEEDVKMVKETIKDNDKDSNKTNLLDEIVSLSKDLDFYKEYHKSHFNGYEYDEKYFVSKTTFKENTDKFFNELKDKKYTYKQFMKEIDDLNRIWDENYNELVPLYNKVDSLCSSFQKMVDSTETESRRKLDSLSRLIDLKIVDIEKTYRDFKKGIEVHVQFINRTGKPIEALSFTIDLTDKLGYKLTTLDLYSNDGVSNSGVQYWFFEKDEYEDIYKTLENVRANQVITKYRLKKINSNGTIIGKEVENLKSNEYLHCYQNIHYTTPLKRLNGRCSYLIENDPYTKKINEIRDKRDKEMNRNSFPVYNLYFNVKVFDFSEENIKRNNFKKDFKDALYNLAKDLKK
jgi:hypothetical protein